MVETGAAHDKKVRVPVLFGRNGKAAKTFEVDAYSQATRTVIEVEAGRAVVNNQFLKDLFEACVMPNGRLPSDLRAKRLSGHERLREGLQLSRHSIRERSISAALGGVLVIGY